MKTVSDCRLLFLDNQCLYGKSWNGKVRPHCQEYMVGEIAVYNLHHLSGCHITHGSSVRSIHEQYSSRTSGL